MKDYLRLISFFQGEAHQYLVLSMYSPLQRSSKVSQALLTAPRL